MDWLNGMIGKRVYIKVDSSDGKGHRRLHLELLSTDSYGILCSSSEDSRIFIPWSSVVLITTDLFV